jgi:hypothetical protein
VEILRVFVEGVSFFTGSGALYVGWLGFITYYGNLLGVCPCSICLFFSSLGLTIVTASTWCLFVTFSEALICYICCAGEGLGTKVEVVTLGALLVVVELLLAMLFHIAILSLTLMDPNKIYIKSTEVLKIYNIKSIL